MTKIFDEISTTNQRKLLNLLKAHIFTFKSDKTILSTIKHESIIGIVLEGHIQVIYNNYSGDKIIIENLKEKDTFGTMLIPIASDDYEVITLKDTKIAIIDYENIFNNSFYNYSYYGQFMNNLINIMKNELNQKNERIELLSKKTIRNKLLEYFKIKTENRITKNIYLPFTFIELAAYLGVDRSAMHRELKHLQEEGLIEIKNKKITLKY
jgi:CRP-like cAMP-binding protein